MTLNPGAAMAGDTIQLILAFQANLSGAVDINLLFPNWIAPPNQGVGETQRDSIISVDSGTAYNIVIPMKIYQYGGSLLQATVSRLSPILGYQNYASAHLEIQNYFPGSLNIVNQGSPRSDTGTLTYDTPQNLRPAHLIINGKVLYQEATFPYNPKPYRGVYDVRVVLLFHRSQDSGACPPGPLNLNFFHPVPGCIEGTHWSKVDVNGNFHFDFIANLGSWSAYSDVVLLVTKWNDAADLQNASSNPFGGGCGKYSSQACNLISYYTIKDSGGCSPWHTFEEPYYSCLPTNNTTLLEYDTDTILLDDFNGMALRNAELSKEFDSVRYGVRTAQSPTYPCEISHCCWGGGQCNGPDVWLTTDVNDAAVDHEFGHHFHWTFSPSSFFGKFCEGYAQWHQFAVRNYAHRQYGDDDGYLHDSADNPEWMPFQLPPHRYTDAYTASQPPYPQEDYYDDMMCFLWNVYDKYNDPVDRSTYYDDSDNDDIGEPMLAFNLVDSLHFVPTDRQFADSLEARVSAAEAASIEDIYQFTMGNGSHKMRPAQVTAFSASNNGLFTAHFSWNYQNYSSVPYQNPPSGVRIYQINLGTGGWDLLGTAAYPATSIDLGYEEHSDFVFKATAYNISGESYDPPTYTASWKKSVDGTQIPFDTGLEVTVHPNPAGNYTRICVADLPADMPAIVQIVNQDGDVVATLYNAVQDAECGLCLTWNSRNFPSGTYYAHIANSIMGRAVKISIQH